MDYRDIHNRNEQHLDEAANELRDLESDLDRNPENHELQREQAKLLTEIRHLKKEGRENQNQVELAATVFADTSQEKRDLNPAVDVLIDLYVDGDHITPEPGEFLRIDDQLNLTSEKKEIDQVEIDLLKADIADMKERGSDPREINRIMDKLSEATRPFKPQFYVTLSELSSLANFTQFTQTYTGNARSANRVEKNMALLLKLIFSRKEIEFNNQPMQIAEYRWWKSYFPPFGYQTGRGYVPIRTVSADTLQFTFTPEDIARIADVDNYIASRPLVRIHNAEAADFMNTPYYDMDRAIDDHLIKNYPDQLTAAVKKYGDVELANHAAFLTMPDVYYRSLSAEKRAGIFVYEYLAYRLSIYHTLFATEEWSIFSEIPYFSSSKKNSDLLLRLIKFAPDEDLRRLVTYLAKFWLKEDIRLQQTTAQNLHQMQILYWTRLFVQMKQRIEYMHLGLNYTIIQTILKEATECSVRVHKDQTIRCMSKISKNAMQKYFTEWKPHALPKLQGIPPAVEVCPESLEEDMDFPILDFMEGIRINGTQKEEEEEEEEEDFKPSTHLKEQLDVTLEIDRLNSYFKRKTASNQVRRYVSLYHNLPSKLQCLYQYMQRLQVYSYTLDMVNALKDWEVERNNLTRTNQELGFMLNQTCLDAVMATLTNEPCLVKLKTAYNLVEAAAAKYLKRSNMDDYHVEFHALNVKFDPWYEPLHGLQKAYTETFDHYRTVAADLLAEISKIQTSPKRTVAADLLAEISKIQTSPKKDEFNRKINQLDYAIDAFETLSAIQIPLKPVTIPPICKDTEDYKKVTRYLNVLFDLLENKVLRGIVWDADFKFKRERCKTPEDMDTVLQSANFLKSFSKLDPECFVDYVKVDLKDLDIAQQLLTTSLDLICQGKMKQGEEAVHLALLFHHTKTGGLYEKCRNLLFYLWMSRGKAKNAERIENLEAGEISRRIYMLHYGNWYTVVSDKRVAERVMHFRIASNSLFVSGKEKSLLKKFAEYPKDSTPEYRSAYVNYKRIQAALGKETARHILTDEFLKEADLETVLPHFPSDHPVSNVVAQVNTALNHENFNLTFKFVAKYIYRHRFSGRAVVYESVNKCPVVEVDPVVDRLRKTDDKIRFAGELTASARTERENEWPKKLDDVTVSFFPAAELLNRTQEFPYVDGNYTVRCVVTLKLLTQRKPSETCDEKNDELMNVAANVTGLNFLKPEKRESETPLTSTSETTSDTPSLSLT